MKMRAGMVMALAGALALGAAGMPLDSTAADSTPAGVPNDSVATGAAR